MAVYDTPAKLIMAQRARLVAGVRSISDATERLADMGREDMVEQSQGPLSRAKLRRMGHPYARTGGAVAGAARGAKPSSTSSLKGQIRKNGMVQRLPINKQTGRLARGIMMSKKNPYRFEVFSTAPHAKYVLAVDGTKRMVPRGLKGPKGLLRRRWKLRRHVVVDHIKKAHKSV